MARENDPAFADWIDRARQVQCVDEIDRRSHGLKRHGHEWIGPCPACGGRDRFSINIRKNLFYCRKSGKGGDAIAMVQYLDGADFLGACEILLNEPPPDGSSGRKLDPELQARRARDAEAAGRAREHEQNVWRDREIARAREIWKEARPIAGSIAERYLEHRGVRPAPGAKVRSLERLSFWHHYDGDWRRIHQGPAMVAAIQAPDGRFAGVHLTYIDPALLSGAIKPSASGKVQLFAPDTGEELPAKKIRGSAKGGHIHLAGPLDALALRMGEGIETVYSVREADLERGLGEILYWSSISLSNMGGRARESIPHPTLMLKDKRGRERRQRVPGAVPQAEEGVPVLLLPAHVRDVTLLGDGDSDRFTTLQVLRRAATRFRFDDAMMTAPARADRDIRIAWADEGADFNSMLRGVA